MASSVGPPSALSLTDKHKYREQLTAEVDGLRRQVEELRQHVQHGGNQDTQQFMAQLKNGFNPQQAQFGQRNLLNSLSSPMGGANQQGTGNPNDDIGQELMQRKQAELDAIMEQQRKLYSNLDNLDRQRSQILGDIDKTAALNFHLQQQQQQQAGNGRFPSNLRGNFAPNFSSPMNQMRGTGNMGFPMDFLNRNKSSSDIPPSLMDNNFGGVPSGFTPKSSAAGAALGTLRGRFQQMEENDGRMDKRRRFGLPDAQKQNLRGFKNFPDQRISSSYLPTELMGTPKSNADSLSVLSSSHQLLMSQREANMQRDMLFFQGMNKGMNPMFTGLNRAKPQHDGKLPETKRKLTKDFVPEVDTVVLGKGNIPKTNIGNLKLKGIVMDNLVEYANGERRKKIAVISRIINHVTSNNYKTTGFVKFEDDCWYEMTERDARVKITALFRDCLHDQYRSSSSSKVKRRQELRKSRSLAASSAAEKEAKEKAAKEELDKKEEELSSKSHESNEEKTTKDSEKESLKRKNESI